MEISLRELFITFFKINMFTFGGGYTIVPVIRGEFVSGRGLIDDDEMLDIIAIAQSGPGPMAINTSILTGLRLRGISGALICLIASVLPCLIIISALFFVYREAVKNSVVRSALETMSGAISAVLLITVYQMSKKALSKNKIFGVILFLLSFLVGYFTEINTAIIIFVAGVIGFVTFSIINEDMK